MYRNKFLEIFKRHAVFCLFATLIVFIGGSAAWANPVTIGFDGVQSTPGIFIGPVTEMGFVYSNVGDVNGLFYDSNYGNPKPEMESTALLTSYYAGNDAGILQVIGSASGLSFFFLGMDIAQLEGNPSATHIITVEGFLQGSPVGTDYFNTPKSDQGSSRSPYITVVPNAGLSNAIIDKLLIHLPGKNASSENIYFFTRIDNIRLNAVPEPATMLLLGLGLMGLAGVRKFRN